MIIQGAPSNWHLFKAYLHSFFTHENMRVFVVFTLLGGFLGWFCDYQSVLFYLNEKNVKRTIGTITDSGYSSTTETPFGETDTYYFKYRFLVDGKKYSGKSYGEINPEAMDREGMIQYLTWNPNISKIEGMSGGVMPTIVFLFAIFFLGMAFYAFFDFLRMSIRQIWILRKGIIFKPKFVKTYRKKGRFFSSDYRQFEYQVNGKQHEVDFSKKHFLKDFEIGERKVWMVHHSDYPKQVLLVSKLPKLLQRNFVDLD